MAEPLPPIGFWSYASSDEADSFGWLRKLRLRLTARLRQQTGDRATKIWQDQDAIPTGADWKTRIDAAIAQSSFFVPIITPGFLISEWCCKELIAFDARMRDLGKSELIFPVHYMNVGAPESLAAGRCHDPAILPILRKAQWQNFTHQRWHSADLDAPSDPQRELLQAIFALAHDIREELAKGVPGAGASAGEGPPSRLVGSGDGHRPIITPSPAIAPMPAPSWLTPFSRWRDRIPGLPDDACPEMITLPEGTFVMGAPKSEAESRDDERPQRQVTMPRFALGRCAVTFAQWDAARVAGAKLHVPDDEGWGRGDHPVINVSWNDAQAYCAWLNGRLGLPQETGYRLPSEAEWEYACRAGTTTPFSFGATISTDQVNYDGNYTYGSGRKGAYRKRTVPVGSLPANAWGLHELHGNVLEWCEDWYGPYPNQATDAAPLQHRDGKWRVLRGGCWNYYPRYARSATRSNGFVDENRSSWAGFRLARTPGPIAGLTP